LEFVTIICFAFIGAFKHSKGETTWLWDGRPFGAMLLVLGAISGALIWVRIERRKMEIKIKNLKKEYETNINFYAEKLDSLTRQQRSVFDLIAVGKSNKEIASELFIELSTLKTHINQIYKKLEVANRREALAFAKKVTKNEE